MTDEQKTVRTIDVETLESKEYAKLAELISDQECRDLITSPVNILEEVYTNYFVEKKKRFDELKQEEQYSKDCGIIKDVKAAERDRIKPEKNLFDLALVLMDGKDEYTADSKEYKRAVKTSGKDYIKEFSQKSYEELQAYCIQFYMTKKKVEIELLENSEYQDALSRKKAAEDDIKSDLKPLELRSKLVLVELKNRREFSEELKEIADGE